MSWLPTFISVASIALSLAAACFWAAATYRIIRELLHARPLSGRRVPALPEEDLPPVTIIVPAHNEAPDIADLVASLLQQDYPRLRARIALDRCTDDTERIVREAAATDDRLDYVTIDHCPPDWAGKVHAAHRAVDAGNLLEQLADSDWLLFTDADTTFHPRLVRTAVECALTREAKFLSLFPTLRARRWFERIVQPIAAGQFLQIYPLRLASRRDERQRPVANGQFMLFRKDAYLAAGTHEAVRRFLLEDLAFARKLKKARVPMVVLPAGELLRCGMYEDYKSFREGWKRIYIDSMHRKVARLRKATRRQRLIGWGLLLTYSLNLAALLLGDVSGAALRLGLLFLAQIAILAPAYVGQGAGIWATLFYPISALLVGDILADAADDLQAEREIRWGGRTYKLTPRSGQRVS